MSLERILSSVKNKKVAVAFSGGADSTFTALKLLESGAEPIGVFMDNGFFDYENARKVAHSIGIPLKKLDVKKIFRSFVISYFIKDSELGRTPNPCAVCNIVFKFGFLKHFGRKLGAELYFTGHHIIKEKLKNGDFFIKRPTDPKKDQSYVISIVPKKELADVWFVSGFFKKDNIREYLISRNVPFIQSESNDLCFLSDEGKSHFLRKEIKLKKGNIIDENGNILSSHRGVALFSIGQRKGLGIVSKERLYVKEIRDNDIIVAPRSSLFTKSFRVGYLNWWVKPKRSFKGYVVVRNKMLPQECVVLVEPKGHAKVIPKKPIWGVAPGQISAFYDQKGRVIAGAWIL